MTRRKSLFDAAFDTAFDFVWWVIDGENLKGRYGERRIARRLEGKTFPSGMLGASGPLGTCVRNVYAPLPDGAFSEVDVALVNEKGLFVIESKNYSGWIFGSEAQKMWTQTFPSGRKERFYNPVRQNAGHIKALRAALGNDVPMFSVVVFSSRCELKKVHVSERTAVVCQQEDVRRAVRLKMDALPDALSAKQIEEALTALRPMAKAGAGARRAHAEHVREIARTGKGEGNREDGS